MFNLTGGMDVSIEAQQLLQNEPDSSHGKPKLMDMIAEMRAEKRPPYFRDFRTGCCLKKGALLPAIRPGYVRLNPSEM